MSFTKITEADKEGKKNVGMPDTPQLNTSEMQELLDALPNLAIDSFNRLIDELEANTAAASIGATVPEGFEANENLQSVLNNMVLTLTSCNTAKHSHSNKETIDSITSSVKSGYDALVILLAGITGIQTVLSISDSAIPTSKAVVDYCAGLNIDAKARQAAYPIGSVYSTTLSIDPSQILGFGSWTLADTDENGIKRYIRRE